MAAEAFDVFGRGGPRQPNNIIKIKPRGARANSSPLLIGVSHRFRVYGRPTLPWDYFLLVRHPTAIGDEPNSIRIFRA